ncbi:hypothetical protein [Coralloluteibacterium stylophorae]|uniref:Uncharacterized protein n=1 Tax=Coralloluteibacterium stylophorae TaxID=1776034 RepID=A0A8J7VQK3_9GAMM|nr:hypothetical protein [Coralloluteibacterium stylophorae]MBS7456863.1 hypothetical protein [Coralloluteibacterium stylophorae]
MAPTTSTPSAPASPVQPHVLSLRAQAGRASLHADLSISTSGLWAVAGLVSGILLSTAVIVAVATRKLPDDTLPPRLRRG